MPKQAPKTQAPALSPEEQSAVDKLTGQGWHYQAVMVPRSPEQGAPSDAVYQLRKSTRQDEPSETEDVDDDDLDEYTEGPDSERH